MREALRVAAFLGLVALASATRRQTLAQEGDAPRPVEVRQVWFPEEIGRSLHEGGGWLPVYVELDCLSGEAEAVLLEASVFVDRKPAFRTRQWVEVAPGAPRRAWCYVLGFPGELQQRATFEVRTPGGEPIRRGDEWFLSSHSYQSDVPAILVVGQQIAGTTPWPSGTPFLTPRGERQAGWVAQGTGASRLPDSVLGYQGVHIVILRDLQGERMEPRQVEALRNWVYFGGVLIVQSSTKSGDVFRSRIVGELAGARIVEPESEILLPLHMWLDDPDSRLESRGLATNLDISPEEGTKTPELTLLDPVDGEGELEIQGGRSSDPDATQERRRLYAELRYGQGKVGFVTFTGERLDNSNVAFLRHFWGWVLGSVVGHTERGAFSRQTARMVAPGLERELNDPSRDVGVLFFFGLVAGYLVLIGPGIYFILKWKSGLPRVVWVEPVVVVAYLGVIFAVAYVNKGVLTKRRIWTVISQQEGEPLATRESYLTVFSATEAEYRVDAPRGFLLRPVFRNEEQQAPVSLTRRGLGAGGEATGPEGLSLGGFRLAQWEQGHLVNLDVLDLEGTGILIERIEVPRESGEPSPPAELRITNRLPFAVRQAVVYDDRGAWMVPRLEPGDRTEVVLDAPQEPAPGGEEEPWLRLLETSRAFRKVGFGLPGSTPLLLAADLEREEEDFHLDLRSSLKEKIDLYLLFQSP